ncbi:MAG: DNA cytosine methyltransferase [Desulfobacteraceae bacterium]|nr:DNA cytosine methyltransferase [Desulfobacteraceae bacterium]
MENRKGRITKSANHPIGNNMNNNTYNDVPRKTKIGSEYMVCKMIHNDNTLTFIDMFCGAGGFSLGFQEAGFKCIKAIDNDKSVFETYKQNFGNHISLEEITERTPLNHADVIIGSPPCQGFSSAGMRNSEDKRNSLVRVFAEIVARQKPNAFVFENVEGFLTIDQGKRVTELLDPLIQSGYCIHLRKINAANYGVPQHRKRVIAIGGLGWEPLFVKPSHMAFGAPGASRILKNLPPCPSFRDALSDLPKPKKTPPGKPSGHYTRSMSDLDLQRIQLLDPGQTMKDIPEKLWHKSYRRRAYRRVKDGTPTEKRGGAPSGLKRLYSDKPCKAITSGAASEFVHPIEDRFLTLRECARIQTFPDSFEFHGSFAQCIMQIGNAVPFHLSLLIAQSLKASFLNQNTFKKKGKLLSFLPTNSCGMSPSLKITCDLIKEKFNVNIHQEQEQLELWL